MEASPGVFQTPWFGLAEGSVIPEENQPGLPPSAILHPKQRDGRAWILRIGHVTRAIRAAVHATHRRSLAISATLPELNLRKLAFEEGKQPGALQFTDAFWPSDALLGNS